MTTETKEFSIAELVSLAERYGKLTAQGGTGALTEAVRATNAFVDVTPSRWSTAERTRIGTWLSNRIGTIEQELHDQRGEDPEAVNENEPDGGDFDEMPF